MAERLGPRFFDWQLAQSPEESWRECHLHARNLLGEDGYKALLEQTERGDATEQERSIEDSVHEDRAAYKSKTPEQGELF